jgi:hypothetical protein
MIEASVMCVDMVRVLLVSLGVLGAGCLVVLIIAGAVASLADRRRNRAVQQYERRLRRHSAPDYECEDCIGMREHGCYCQAMGAREPGGPL